MGAAMFFAPQSHHIWLQPICAGLLISWGIFAVIGMRVMLKFKRIIKSMQAWRADMADGNIKGERS
jgi:hypothetical protein